MYAKSRRKKFLIPAAILLLAALGGGIWFAVGSGSEPVNVYPFQYIGMTEFWGDNQESYGPVTTDKIQTEFLSDTQTITEVAVKDGDMVKKGDVLFSFDTTLDALSLERKRLEVEKVKVQIKAAEERLQDTRDMVPYEPPKPTESKEEDLGDEWTESLMISPLEGKDKKPYNGATKDTAIICWMKDGTPISDALLEDLFKTAKQYQTETPQAPDTDKENAPESSASNVPEEKLKEPGEIEYQPKTIPQEVYCDEVSVSPDKMPDLYQKEYKLFEIYKLPTNEGEKTYWIKSAVRKSDGQPLLDFKVPMCPQDEEGKVNWEEKWGKGIEVHYTRSFSFDGIFSHNGEFVTIEQDDELSVEVGETAAFLFSSYLNGAPTKDYDVIFTHSSDDLALQMRQEGNHYFLTGEFEDIVSDATITVTAHHSFKDTNEKPWDVIEKFSFRLNVVPKDKIEIGKFYVVFKSTKDNRLKGIRTLWQGVKVTAYDNGTFDMQLYDPYEVEGFDDHTIEKELEIEIDLPVIDPNHMYTAEEILDMQKQCYAIIKEQNEKLKLAETEYQIMERELGDGNVYAEIDGKVVSLLTEEEARQQKQPIVKVSGGGGFYIEGSVSELQRESLKLGQEVTINDWQNGGMYTGEVVSIGDFPSDNDNWNGMGNPTASYYPFKAFVSEDADLQAGSYVSMSYSTASAEQGIYLEKAFVRTEKGNSYIFVRGADGKLEKRPVKVGKVLWGSYYEILSPLGEEDCLAFPYGKNVKQGAPTVESDLNALYGY